MLGDGLVRGLVLTADSQPDVAFVPLDQPAVPSHPGGQVEHHQGGEQEEKLTDSGCHGAKEDFLKLPHRKKTKGKEAKGGGGRPGCRVRLGAGQGQNFNRVPGEQWAVVTVIRPKIEAWQQGLSPS